MDDLDTYSDLMDLETSADNNQQLSLEITELLRRTYEVPGDAIQKPLDHFNSLYYSDSFLHNLLSIYWLPSFLQRATMDGLLNNLFGQLRLMACTRTSVTKCHTLFKEVFPEKDVLSSIVLPGYNSLDAFNDHAYFSNSSSGPVLYDQDDQMDEDTDRDEHLVDRADPFMDNIFRAVTLGKAQNRVLSTDERLSLLKYLLCYMFKDIVRGLIANTSLSEGQCDYILRNVLFPILKCILRSTPCHDTISLIITVLYKLPTLAESAATQRLWALLLFREVILFQFVRCFTVFCNISFKHDNEMNVYCQVHSLFGGVVSKSIHTENYPPVLRCRCRYQCVCTGNENDERIEQIEQSMVPIASWNDCYTLSFHNSGSEDYYAETSRHIKANSQIYYQEKRILSQVPDIEDILLSLMDIMVHYATSYCASPNICNSLFTLMGRVATDRTIHDAFLKELEDILNVELTKVFYQRLGLSVSALWKLQNPHVCKKCHPSNSALNAPVDTSCCDLHRFLGTPHDGHIPHKLLYPQSQPSNLIKPATDYSYKNGDAKIVSAKIQRAAILNMAHILFVYATGKALDHAAAAKETGERSTEIAYRQSQYVTRAEGHDNEGECQGQDVTVIHHSDDQAGSMNDENGTNSIEILCQADSSKPLYSRDLETEGETEVETEHEQEVERSPGILPGSATRTFSLIQYLHTEAAPLKMVPPDHLLRISSCITSAPSLLLPTTKLPYTIPVPKKKASKPTYLKNTVLKKCMFSNQTGQDNRAFVIATQSMQRDVIAFVRTKLYSKDNVANLVFCAEALPLFCRAFDFRSRINSLLFTFVKLLTNRVSIVQQNAFRNIGCMLSGISRECTFTEEEKTIISANYLFFFVFNLYCNILQTNDTATSIKIQMHIPKSHIYPALLESYNNSCQSFNSVLHVQPSSFSSNEKMSSKSMLTELVQMGQKVASYSQLSPTSVNGTGADTLGQGMVDGKLMPSLLSTTAATTPVFSFDQSSVASSPMVQTSEDTSAEKTPAGTPYSLQNTNDNDTVAGKKGISSSYIEESGPIEDSGQIQPSSSASSLSSSISRSDLEMFIQHTENHPFHLKRIVPETVAEIPLNARREIELSLLRALPGVFETVACYDKYQTRVISIITKVLMDKTSNNSVLKALIAALPDIYANKYTTEENRKDILDCLTLLLCNQHCEKDIKLIFLYSVRKYAANGKIAEGFLLRLTKILISMYYSLLQLPEEIEFHEGQLDSSVHKIPYTAEDTNNAFCLQCTPDMYISITPKSFTSHVSLETTGLYGFVPQGGSNNNKSSSIQIPKLVYNKAGIDVAGNQLSASVYNYAAQPSDTGTTYTFFSNADWRYRCDVVECLVKHIVLYCTVFSVRAGFFIFLPVLLRCLKDNCQTVSDCLVRSLGLELTPLLQNLDEQESLPLTILSFALFGKTYKCYGINNPSSSTSIDDYSLTAYSRLCHLFLLPSLRNQKLGVRLIHHVSRRVHRYDWFARTFLLVILSVPNYDHSVQLSFIVSILNLSKKGKAVVFSDEHLQVMRMCGSDDKQLASYVGAYEELRREYFL